MYNMYNRNRFLFSLLMVIFLGVALSISCSAETEREKNYIVEFKNQISLFQADESRGNLHVLTEAELSECLKADMVAWYEEDYVVELLEETTGGEETLNNKWHLDMIGAKAASDLCCYGQCVRVAVIDSGVVEHEDLANNILSGYNYIAKTEDVTDNIGHGTFVSGLIAAETNAIGIEGVAAKAQIIPLKCFDNGKTTTVSMIKDAIYDAVDVYHADIINMSFGLTQYSEVLKTAIDYAVNHGVLVVASVGNKGTETLYYPAAFENVIGVGSVDSLALRSSFSQKNESVFVSAPGEAVYSTTNTNGYGTNSGTSFSAPQVAAALAVMLSVDSSLTMDEAFCILEKTSVDTGAEGYDTSYGHGILNIENIIQYMLKDVDYFISPIDVTKDSSQVAIYNNTESVFSGVLFMNRYKRGVFMDFEHTAFTLEAKKILKIPSAFCSDTLKCYIWKDIRDISVLGMFRVRGIS